MSNFFATCVMLTQSFIVEFEIGMKGHTSTQPIRGCSPECVRISISSIALRISRMAACSTSFSSSKSDDCSIIVWIWFYAKNFHTINSGSINNPVDLLLILPSEMLGTHSTIWSGTCWFSGRTLNIDPLAIQSIR